MRKETIDYCNAIGTQSFFIHFFRIRNIEIKKKIEYMQNIVLQLTLSRTDFL